MSSLKISSIVARFKSAAVCASTYLKQMRSLNKATTVLCVSSLAVMLHNGIKGGGFDWFMLSATSVALGLVAYDEHLRFNRGKPWIKIDKDLANFLAKGCAPTPEP